MPLTSSVMRQSVSNSGCTVARKNFRCCEKMLKSLLEQLQVCIFAEIVFGVRCTLSLVQILEGSRLLSLRLSVIPLQHPLHRKIKCLNLTPFNYFAKHLVPSE